MSHKLPGKMSGKIRYWLMLFGCVVLLIASIAIELTPNAVKTAVGVPLVVIIGTLCIIGSSWGIWQSLYKIFDRPRLNNEHK